ncbi:hypothetical protein KKH3_26670 [Pectobacterium actinidiae]|nr:hypothetical protein KKH3_26670 [Pectobacterium actinidiae]
MNHSLSVQTAILIQDPLMQRRTFESFVQSGKQKELTAALLTGLFSNLESSYRVTGPS